VFSVCEGGCQDEDLGVLGGVEVCVGCEVMTSKGLQAVKSGNLLTAPLPSTSHRRRSHVQRLAVCAQHSVDLAGVQLWVSRGWGSRM